MKPLSQEWIDKAEGDFKVAINQFGLSDPIYDAICFHAQQCVEKYFKAWLTEQSLDIPRTPGLSNEYEDTDQAAHCMCAIRDLMRNAFGFPPQG